MAVTIGWGNVGTIPIKEYRRGLTEAGFAAVEVIDNRADLNAYAKVKNQSAAALRRWPRQAGCRS